MQHPAVASILSISDRTVREWLSRVDKDAKEARNKRIFELWLACWTAEEIATEIGIPVSTVKEIWPKTEDSPFPSKSDKAAADHAVDFDVPT